MGKIVTIIGVLLITSFVFLAFGGTTYNEGGSIGVMSDFQTNYLDSGISNAIPDNNSYVETFDVTSDLNDTLGTLAGKLQQETDQNSTFLGDLFRGGVLLFSALFYVPAMLFTILANAITLVGVAGKDILGIPEQLTNIAVVAVLAWASFKLVAFARRFDA